MSDFEHVLTSQLRTSRLDAQFLSKCFSKGGDVDVIGFIKECGASITGN